MGFFTEFLRNIISVTVEQTTVCHTEARQVVSESVRQTSSNTQRTASPQERSKPANTTRSPVTSAQPTLVKEPNDLGTPDLSRPTEVSWLDNPQKVRIALNILNRDDWGSLYYWNKYYVERMAVEAIVHEQKQWDYDNFWQKLRNCWQRLYQPFWRTYLAGHFPNPQAVKDSPTLAREICVLDVKEFKHRQTQSLIEDEVYTLGMLQNSLFSDHWYPMGINEMDKWYFRKILIQYGLEVPPSGQPDPTPFAELFIGAVFGIQVTPENRLSNYDFIQGDEPLEDRVRRIQEEDLVYKHNISDCEDVMFYLYPEDDDLRASRALRNAQKSLKARKILAGVDYPEVRSAIVEGVDLDQLDQIFVKDLDLSLRARRSIRENFDDLDITTVADLVRAYHNWLIYENDTASTEIKEYLYQHNYVIRPEDMPMDERTHIAYLELPTRVRQKLRYPGCVETVGDLVRCCSGEDPVFSLQDAEGIGKKSMEAIRARLMELGFLTDSQ